MNAMTKTAQVLTALREVVRIPEESGLSLSAKECVMEAVHCQPEQRLVRLLLLAEKMAAFIDGVSGEGK